MKGRATVEINFILVRFDQGVSDKTVMSKTALSDKEGTYLAEANVINCPRKEFPFSNRDVALDR